MKKPRDETIFYIEAFIFCLFLGLVVFAVAVNQYGWPLEIYTPWK